MDLIKLTRATQVLIAFSRIFKPVIVVVTLACDVVLVWLIACVNAFYLFWTIAIASTIGRSNSTCQSFDIFRLAGSVTVHLRKAGQI